MSTLFEKYQQRVNDTSAMLEENAKKTAFVLARKLVTEQYQDVPPEDKAPLIKKIASRLFPRVKQNLIDKSRSKSFIKGTNVTNSGQDEHGEDVNEAFSRMFEGFPGTEDSGTGRGYGSQRQSNPVGNPVGGISPTDKVIVNINPPSKTPPPWVVFGPPDFRPEDPKLLDAIMKKAQKANLPTETLQEVFNRGVDSWTLDTNVSPAQFAFARVNSFINKGKAYELDADLLDESALAALGATAALGAAAYGINKARKFINPEFKDEEPEAPQGYEMWKRERDKAHLTGKAPPSHPNDKEYEGYEKQRENFKQKKKSFAKSVKRRNTIVNVLGTANALGASRASPSGPAGPIGGSAFGPPTFTSEERNVTFKSKLNEKIGNALEQISGKIVTEDVDTISSSSNKIATIGGPRQSLFGAGRIKQTPSSIENYNSRATLGGQKAKSTFQSPTKPPSNVSASGLQTPLSPTNTSQNVLPVRENTNVTEATYQGRKVPLNKPMKGDVKKSKVYVDPDGDGKAQKVNFGDKNLSIKKNIADRKRSYCARSSGQGNLTDKTSANYWSRRAWNCEDTDLDGELVEKRGLWDNIHSKRKRIEGGSGEHMRKPGSKGAPTDQDFKDAQESVQESNNTPYVRPHIEKGSTQQSAWKASNKHGRVKYFGMDFKKAAIKHAGITDDENIAEDVPNAEPISSDRSKSSSRFWGSTSLADTYKQDTPGQTPGPAKKLNESFELAFDYQGKPQVAPTAGDLMMRAQGAFAHHTDVQNVIDVQAIKESIQSSFENAVLEEDVEILHEKIEELVGLVEEALVTIEEIKQSNVEQDAWSTAEIMKLEKYIDSVVAYLSNLSEEDMMDVELADRVGVIRHGFKRVDRRTGKVTYVKAKTIKRKSGRKVGRDRSPDSDVLKGPVSV